jgi:arylsulfatase A-like enzyme
MLERREGKSRLLLKADMVKKVMSSMRHISILGRREFLKMLGLGAAGLIAANSSVAQAATRKPNIIVIVADDLGYADLGCQGATDLKTPHIDALAANGVRFTDGYVSCPVCSPTRAGLLTGRYQERFGHEFNPGADANSPHFGLPLSQKTLADQLKAAGYVTGMVGKWHLGAHPKFHPLKRGFDEFFGFLGGLHPYIDLKATGPHPILRGTRPVDEKEYLTDAFTREAVAFIDRHRQHPFFLYLPFNAVHAPMDPPPEKYLERFTNIADEHRRTFAAMLAAMDDGVGAVLEKLRAAKLEEQTLIFFISDNGGPTPVNTSRNNPLSGHKAQVLEGGIRVPFMVQWKGRIPPAVVHHPVISLDIFPTALAAAGAKPPKDLDGLNLLPLLSGKNNTPPHEMLFWRFGGQSAVRRGKWKLLKMDQEPQKLFDLETDIAETIDVAAKNPQIKQELTAALAKWDGELAKPLWPGVPAPRQMHE